MKNNFFKDKVAIVTGASSGIGFALALEMARLGSKVVLAARRKDKLEGLSHTIQKLGGSCLIVTTDVTEETQCKMLIDRTIDYYDRIDILINNAGISMRANFLDLTTAVIKKVVDTNFWGAVYCTKYALPHIHKSKGSIVGISSVSGVAPLPGRTGYVASKHALDGFLRTVRVENLETGIHVMLVHPGFTTSNIRNVALNSEGEPQAETPLNESKLMSAEKVAKVVAMGILRRKRNIKLTFEGKLAIWLYRHAPNIAENLIYRRMKKERNAPF